VTRDDERINYLANEGGESLPAEDRAELDELRALLAAPSTWTEPDPGLEDRVIAAIAEQPAGPPTAEPSVTSVRPRRCSLLRWQAFALAGVAVAALAAIVIAQSVNSGSPSEQFAMVVSGTYLAPGAHGSAEATHEDSGWRISLSANGLPTLSNGRYYQAWLKNAAGVLVPVGTFSNAASVTLWSGVPVTSFRTLTVTRQLANGDPRSSGEKVLVGTIRSRS
jgi:Anti-sigma-K factor rskA, C-terminal